MIHYMSFILDAGPEFAVGVRFSDLPDCVSVGNDVHEA